MAEPLLKQLTGGDALKARHMHQDFVRIAPTWKLVVATNHRPTISGTDHAIWRRLRLIPFDVQIPPADKIRNYGRHLVETEGPGILAWAVRGCREWQRIGLSDPPEVTGATAEYRADQDGFGTFLAECCEQVAYARVTTSALLAAYQTWSGDRHITPRKLAKEIEGRGFEVRRSNGQRYVHGLGLCSEESPCGAENPYA